MNNFLNTPLRKVIAAFTAAVLFAIIIASCSGSSQPYGYAPQPAVVAAQPQVIQQAAPAQYAPAPVVVQQAPHNDGLFTGMMLGHMMSGGFNRGTTVVERHTTVMQPSIAPRYAPVAPAQRYVQRSAVATTTVRPTIGGGTRISVSSSRRR
jgi:hypothetical protein